MLTVHIGYNTMVNILRDYLAEGIYVHSDSVMMFMNETLNILETLVDEPCSQVRQQILNA